MSEDLKKKQTAERIRQTREQLGLTQEEMAEDAGLTLDNLRKIEDGSNAMSTTSLRKVKEALKVSFDYLLDGEQHSVEELEQALNSCSQEERIYLLLKLYKNVTRTNYSEKEVYRLLDMNEESEK